MHKKLRMALVAALLMAGGWGATASATSDVEHCDRNGNNSSGCDFDGDGTSNKDDSDDDGDGIPDDEDTCRRMDEPCEGEGGGETPELPVNPEDLIAQVEAAVAEVVAQLPAAPGGEEPPSEEPPSEEPPATDPAAEIQAIVEEVTSQLPAPPADPAAEVQAAVEALVAQLPAPPAP